MWNCNNPYAHRADNLRTLGFASYRDYLHSDLWKSIKARVLRERKPYCERCGSGVSMQVHHRTYDLKTLAGGDMNGLTVTCRSCHYGAEQPNNRARSSHDRLSGANEYLMLTEPSPLDRAWRWYRRYWNDQTFCGSPEEAYAAICTIHNRVARAREKGRCIVCRRLDMESPAALQEGPVCRSCLGSKKMHGVLKALKFTDL